MNIRDVFRAVVIALVVGAIALIWGYWPRPKPKPEPVIQVVTQRVVRVVHPAVSRPPARVQVRKVDPLDHVIDKLILVENPTRDPNKVGDKHLYFKAYGELQIRKPYLKDVNALVGPRRMTQFWGKPRLDMQDMKDPAKARWVAKVYLIHYGREYREDTGRHPTLEVYARIHNGGPDGWRRSSTDEYIRKLRAVIG